MMQILKLDDSPFTLAHVYTFIREVYSDRSAEGIDFWLSRCSFEEYSEKVKNDKKIIFVAFVPDTNELLGTAALTLRRDKKGRLYGGMSNCAVRKSCQGKGIGSKLLETVKVVAIAEKCQYLKSTTAVNAISSVKWHLKNGYKKCGFGSAANSDYYSYVFKMPLKDFDYLYFNGGGYRLDYSLQWCKTRCLFKPDGKRTWVGVLVKKTIGR